jgi:tRNA modification GTPase
MHSQQDSIAAVVTPPGESGIGVIRVSGADAVSLVKRLFRSPGSTDLTKVPSHTCHYGQLVADHPLDQVLITVFRSPHSYTGEDVVEISMHGNPRLLHQALQACLEQGARLADPGEFTQRAFLNGKMDLTQAEAVADLIRAKTDQAQAAALAQLEGQLAAKVRALRDSLLPLLAHVEVGLDHSDEDHDFLSRQTLTAKCAEVQAELDQILISSKVSKILRDGLRVAIVGRPNVGKSSLLNALLKEDRAIVTPIAGTTRDTLEESLNWEGIPVILTDTAGMRQQAADPVEQLGIERSQKALKAADVVLCVLDGSEPLSPEDKILIQGCLKKPHLWVVNKNDLPATWRRSELEALNGKSPALPVSAKTGEGLHELVQAVKQLSLGGQASADDARWLINSRHEAALRAAREALARAAEAAQRQAYEECVALELRCALTALGDILGETATDDLLDKIFSTFCIGK